MIRFLSLLLLLASTKSFAQVPVEQILTGAEQTQLYIPEFKDKRVGVVVNPTSMVGKKHLVDTLRASGVDLKKIFAPEHGFRADADAGAIIDNDYDPKTALPIVSIYGKKKGPDSLDLVDIDVMVFDIQDVGVRFYTYISTLQYVMEACAKYKKPLYVLDRPNPNGYYIDGPVLDKKYASFVGMQPIPVVHGLTVGEYAQMLNGEKWLTDSVQCELHVIACKNYTHSMLYELPVKPSPNLPNMTSIYLYPSLCLFEGTPVSVGRGTDRPFQVYGYPGNLNGAFTFTPQAKAGANKPPYMNQLCRGYDLSYYNTGFFLNKKAIFLNYVIDAYRNYPQKENFFTDFFDKLAGTDKLREDIKAGKNEQLIRLGWQDDIKKYKAIRKKYLLYKDFE